MANGKKSTSDNIVNAIGKKRTLSQALDDVSPSAKKAKQSNGNGITGDEDLIVIEDDGAILIDD